MRHHLKNWCECSFHSIPIDRACDTPFCERTFHSIPIDRACDTSLCECTCHSIPIDRACDTSLFWVPFKLHPWLNITTACPANCGLGLRANIIQVYMMGKRVTYQIWHWHWSICGFCAWWGCEPCWGRTPPPVHPCWMAASVPGSAPQGPCTWKGQQVRQACFNMHALLVLKLASGWTLKADHVWHAHIISLKACVWVDSEGRRCLICTHY